MRGPRPLSTDPRWLVIVNPAAGRGRGDWPAFAAALRHEGLDLDVVTTDAPGAATHIARRFCRDGIECLMVAGGDGTVHEVVNGLMQARTARESAPVLVPVPVGTGNDWARSLGLPRDPARFAATVAQPALHEIFLHDVGRLRFDTAPETSHWFVNVAGAGFDAHVIAAMGTRRVTRFGYLLHALRELDRWQAPQLRLESTGQAPHRGRLLLAFVAIGRYCGHRMHVAPDAVPDDGLYDVLTIDDVRLLSALPKLWKLYRGTLAGDPLVQQWRTPALRIDADPPTPVEADGQLVGNTPVTFELEPRAMRVLRARA